MNKVWIKKCKCGNFIPDEYELCDNCLLKKYNLYPESIWFSNYGTSFQYFPEEEVIRALREAIGDKSLE